MSASFHKISSPMGRGLGRPWALFARPKRVFYLALAGVVLYCMAASWASADSLATVLRSADILKDGRIGAMFRLGALEVSSVGPDYSEDQLPFDDANATARKTDQELRDEFDREYAANGLLPGAGKLYGGTLANLEAAGAHGSAKSAKGVSVKLTPWSTVPAFSSQRPHTMDPYPSYNSWGWRRTNHARFESCAGPQGQSVADVSAFVGLPRDFPAPALGSYDVFEIDAGLCYERDTRLGVYALPDGARDTVDWGELQAACVERNKARYELQGPSNDLVVTAYGPIGKDTGSEDKAKDARGETESARTLQGWSAMHAKAETVHDAGRPQQRAAETVKEKRTAVLLRSYTGKRYTENDRYIIRALVSELSLHTGGEYQVFLLVHVKEPGVDLWDNATYAAQLNASVPREFHGMTLLWNDAFVQETYPRLERSHEASVHNAQWLSVQKFMQEFREFDFVWNWEMDARITGHAYDMLHKLHRFAAAQPRKGLWERNERYYIPAYHGAYDTAFRRSVAALSRHSAVWGAPELPFIRPVGPAPPVASADDDDYAWGVGEDADLVTLSPLFDPRGSGWVLGTQVWHYADANHTSESLPRRGAIVTQCRLSRRLVDIMHVENLRGNHVGSEMAPGTVALLHGLKAVYAPMPIFMDRPWPAERLARWFNNGPRGGSSGGPDSAMGWGREGRFRGTTWYYRADPPQKLYNNWVGFEDRGTGGLEWEMAHGRPCLPAMFLHPVKDVLPTGPGHESESKLPY